MESLLVIFGIIAMIVNTVNKAKKIKNNAPGKSAAPAKPAAPAAPRPQPEAARPSVRPTMQPTVQPANAEQGSFWQQVGAEIMKELGVETEQKAQRQTHGSVPVSEGDSRECEHGSVGGSMEYGSHEGGKAAEEKKQPVRTAYDRKLETAYRPAMNAQEMRRAVVMAEVLKRPQERMAEQARRWSAR